MPRYDFRSPRLHVDSPLSSGTRVALDAGQTNYLRNVLRLKPRDPVLVFNGRDGEWRAVLAAGDKRAAGLVVGEQTRAQTAAPDLHCLFAPLKHARLDYMVQKTVEMGVSHLQPVLTQHTQVSRLNLARMRANAIEAAEQCGILNLPDIAAPVAFDAMIAARDPHRLLVFCDENAEIENPIAALKSAKSARRPQPAAVLIGPEGGFSERERAVLAGLPNMVRIALGPRILRADTAAVAALTLVGAVLGDWGDG